MPRKESPNKRNTPAKKTVKQEIPQKVYAIVIDGEHNVPLYMVPTNVTNKYIKKIIKSAKSGSYDTIDEIFDSSYDKVVEFEKAIEKYSVDKYINSKKNIIIVQYYFFSE